MCTAGYRKTDRGSGGIQGQEPATDLGLIDDWRRGTFVQPRKVGSTGSLPRATPSAYDQPSAVTTGPGPSAEGRRTDVIAGAGPLTAPAGGFHWGISPCHSDRAVDGKASQAGASTGWVLGGTG